MKKSNMALLGSILLTSQAQAAFDPGDWFIYATADNDNTYFVDLDIHTPLAELAPSLVPRTVSSAGLAIFIASNTGVEWRLLGLDSQGSPVSGPPANTQSCTSCGNLGTSVTGTSVTLTGSQVINAGLSDWHDQIRLVSGGASEFSLAGTDPLSANATRNASWFGDAMADIDSGFVNIWFDQPNAASGSTLSDPSFITPYGFMASVSSNGEIEVSAVPVPAAAWFFASGLIGLSTFRRYK